MSIKKDFDELIKEVDKSMLTMFLDWMDMMTVKNPMMFETDNDDIVEMFLASETYKTKR